MRSKRINSLTSYLWLCIVALGPFFFCHFATAEIFPRYKEIEQNVQFWEKIYSTYSLSQAVIHDSNDLSKIYEVIELLDESLPTARQFNQKAQEKAVEKYQSLLKKLSRQRPVTREEKRVAALFTGKYRSRNMGRASTTVRSQKGQKERFKRGVVRSGAYITEIKRIFRQKGLPEDLAYLPHVESSFNTKAYSKFGAAGIWQFTRSTGKRYLSINYSIDERLDPILATHAAAKYLKNSYSNLGDWPLALTSYNYGLPGMIRAQEELGNYPKIFKNYNKGHFKFASRNFYAEFLAARNVAKSLAHKIKTEQPKQVSHLELQGYVGLDTLSRHLQIPPQTILDLNPAIRSPIIKGEKHIPKGYSVRLPKTKKMQSLIAKFPSSVYKKDQKATRYHRVKRGETAGSIAIRYGVSLKRLMKINNLDEYATIFINQKLRIPLAQKIRSHKSKKELASVKTVQKVSTLVAHKKKGIKSISNKKINSFKALPSKNPTVYNIFSLHRKNGTPYGRLTVQPEESLRLYADFLQTSVTNLRLLNNMKPGASVTPGQQLVVPFDKLSPNAFEEKRLDFLKETEDEFFAAFSVIGQKSYTVNTGDTLWDLCYNKFEIPLWLLERYNSAINLSQLNRNQTLVIPIVQQI